MDIFEEIDNELKQEKFVKFISKYMPYAIIALVLIVIFITIKIVWSNYQVSLQEKYSNIFNTVTTSLDNADYTILNESLNYLINLNQKNVFSTLATLHKAKIEINNQNPKNAIILYKSIYNNKNADKSFRQLAGLLSTSYSIELREDNENINDALQNLNKIKGPFNALIQLEQALWLLKNKDKKNAIEILEKLKSNKTNTPFTNKVTEEILTVLLQDK